MSRYSAIRFLKSAWETGQFPPDHGAEVAFAGRSNSGKSSAINAITGRQALARASKTPGRTQLINFFELEPERRLVDLPGYGFAKVPPQMKQHWYELVNGYLSQRQCLSGLIVLMDVRHPLNEMDCDILRWGAERQLSCHILLSKADKLGQGEAKRTLQAVTREVQAFATVQLFSAPAKTGLIEARRRLEQAMGWADSGQ
jgi:GTP-binding protein